MRVRQINSRYVVYTANLWDLGEWDDCTNLICESNLNPSMIDIYFCHQAICVSNAHSN